MGQRSTIGLNSSVTLRFKDGAVKTFEISLHNTAPERGVISFGSPLAQAIIGHSPGERVNYHVAGKELQVDIVDVGSPVSQ